MNQFREPDNRPTGETPQPGYDPWQFNDHVTIEDTVQRHEVVRPFRTSLLAGLGLAVAVGAVLLVAFLLAFLLLRTAGGSPAPTVPSGVTSQTCPDGSAPTSQDGGLICDDGSVPQTSGWINQ